MSSLLVEVTKPPVLNNTLPHRCLHREHLAPNRGYTQDLDPNEMANALVVGDDALKNSLADAVQQRSVLRILTGVAKHAQSNR